MRSSLTTLPKIIKIWIAVAVTFIVLMIGSTLFPYKEDINKQNIVKLPVEAVVNKVKYGDWGGDGKVIFTLPATRPVSSWLDFVWSLNPPEAKPNPIHRRPDTFDSGPYKRLSTHGVASTTLEYDPLDRTYQYSFFGDS